MKWQDHWIHDTYSLRLGGVPILLAAFAGSLMALWTGKALVQDNWQILLLCVLPLFLTGLCNDIFQSISPWRRLYAAAISSLVAILILDEWLISVNLSMLDPILANPILGASVTIFMTVLLSHCYNITDGLNGLSSGHALIALLTLILIINPAESENLYLFLQILFGSILGFWLVNLFSGRFFLGDSGAYLIGFLVAWCCVISANASTEISAWACLLCTIYPVSEGSITVFRRLLAKTDWKHPDKLHFHHLVKHLVEAKAPSLGRVSNSIAASLLLLPSFFAAVIGLQFHDSSLVCALTVLCFLSAHALCYVRLRMYLRPS